MTNTQLVDCNSASNGASAKTTSAPSTSGALERVNFFNGQLLTAADMTTECDYFLQKLRRHNRFLHGWGVVCGLAVTGAPVSATPWRVQIGSGYALGPYGDEIFVGEAVYFDLAACLSGGITNPCEPNVLLPGAAGTSMTVYLAIKYAECLARPVQVAYSGCGCDGEACQYSRIRDSFQIQCLQQPPDQPISRVTLCQIIGGAVAPCPSCPTDPWVVLAKINLPASQGTSITSSNIDVSIRRGIVSTAVLQDQVVQCCCKQQPVDLQEIQVKRHSDPESDFSSSAKLSTSRQSKEDFWDFKVILTGDAPQAGFLVNLSSDDDNTTEPPTPFMVPAGQNAWGTTSLPGDHAVRATYWNVDAPEKTITITAGAQQGASSATATLIITSEK